MKALYLFALALTACGGPPPESGTTNQVGSMGAPQIAAPTAKPVAPPSSVRSYAGRWTGVEGMYLLVTPGPGDAVALEMQWDLDHSGTFVGKRVGDAIAFSRGGTAEVLRPTGGDATGLKYLSGKKDCLTVKPGEGYCRD